MVTRQQHADEALAEWQRRRDLPPEERIESLMRDFFAPPPPSDIEYAATERTLIEVWADA